jgi:DNA repair exonuclease SbcCD ATPase subunit
MEKGELGTQLDQAAAKVTELEAQRERLDADLLTARQTIGSLTQQKGEIETRLNEITARNTALEAAEQDIEKRASKRAAEIVAATGTQAPAPVTPKGDHQADDLLARFKAIDDPKAQTIFWRSLTPAQQAQILAATATSETH